MSASRDKTQKTAFVYSNLYQLYRKGKEAASSAEIPSMPAPESGPESKPESKYDALQSYFQLPNPMGTLASEKNVLKTADLKAQAAPEVSPYQPPSLLAKRIVEKPKAIQLESNHSHPAHPAHPVQSAAIQSLKENLKTLNDLHYRLKFMLEELQELVKD